MAAAMAMVAVLLISGLLVLTSPVSSADTQTVTYHTNGAGGNDITVEYVGIVATEYNPLYWNNSFDECQGNWTAPTESHNYGGQVGTMTVNKVFAGWSIKAVPTAATDLYDPGDVILDTVTDLYAYWALPDIFRSNNTNYQYIAAKTGAQTTPTVLGGTEFADRMYTTQYSISGTVRFGTPANSYATLSQGSYRSLSAYSGSGSTATFHIYNNVAAAGNVVIDNVVMTSTAAGSNHGYGTSAGLYANAHKLIIGTGITNNFGSNASTAPQVFGGANGNSTGTAYSQKAVVSKDSELDGMKFNMGSFVIIHSGTYYNVFAGGRQSMGTSDAPLSTYLVFKHATVLDSVGGGNATDSSSYPINGATNSNKVDQYQGGTFVYAIGLYTLGDEWASNLTGYDCPVKMNEGANFQGGCSYSEVIGSTHVFVSGDSSVWDVQGGGRAGTSKCAFTYVEISGDAEVRHAACGLVTDGTSSANTCAKGTKMMVADNARISMLFGAGYDTWANPTASNMTAGQSIEVEITGGTIGFVYGGGYRGTVGSQGNNLTVTVNISGGDILFDVFGGGRGGIDKMLRTTDGKDPSGSGYLNSTGQSVIYGNVTVNIEGDAHIHGNVYAGGESVPRITRYYGTTFTNNDNNVNVAEVIGSTAVSISGDAVIDGSVYGAGKGIGFDGGNLVTTYTSVDGSIVVTDYYTKNLVLSKPSINGGWTFLEWYNHSHESGSITYDTAAASKTKYEEYARTTTAGTVTFESGDIGGSVYGGGAFSKVGTDSSVNMTGGTVGIDLFGGGLGTLGKQSVGRNSTVSITDGTVTGNVYGGSAYGIVAGNSSVTLDDAGAMSIGESVYGAGLGAATYTSVTGDSSVLMRDGTVGDSVYGGSAYGKVRNASATVNDGIIGHYLYGGGLGTTDVESVTGTSTVILNGGTVGESYGAVYGGAAYGVVTGNSSATVNDGLVNGALYGGGLGTPEHNSVSGSTSAVLNGGEIVNSMYGGCAWGITTGNSTATVTGGTVGGSLYGGGLGTMNIDSVLGNSAAVVSGGLIANEVYGGCAYGVTVGTSRVTVSGGTVNGNIFAGGLGTAKVVSVKSKRYILMNGGTVWGSVYGGSSLGDDASSEAAVTAQASESNSSTYVVVSAGTVGGSVYGGGYKGVTTGTTYVDVGYSDFAGTKSNGMAISVGNSVYGGGDVGELAPGQPMFVDTMVFGGSHVRVNGNNVMSFTGTVSAAGNSCLTKGTTDILIEDLVLDTEIESVHRAQEVTITSSELRFNGKVNGSGDNTKYSFYDLDHLNLKDGTTVYLYAPMSEIGEYNSLNAAGALTKPSAPMNRIYICNGTMFEVKKTVDGVERYWDVNGYTLLSIRTVENYYGALTLGAKSSPGGFVIESDGSYVVADTTEFSDCKCWFISGSLQTVTSVTLFYDSGSPVGTVIDDGGQYLNVPTLSKDTGIRYSGGFFSSDAGYTLVESTTPGVGEYSVQLGTNTEGRENVLLLDGGTGMFLPPTFDSTNDVYDMENRKEQPIMQITAYGLNEDANKYIGYGVIYLQEVVPVQYRNAMGVTVTDYIVQNRIEVRVDMYIEGSTTDVEDTEATLQTVRGDGYVDVIVPATLSDYTVRLKSVTTDLTTPLFVSASKNNGGTIGWNYPLRTIDVTGGYFGPAKEIQSLTGAFMATLRISVTGFDDDPKSAEFVFDIVDPSGIVSDTFKVDVDIKKHDPVSITFKDGDIVRPPYSFDYGITITEADCPNTDDNFVGWYTDENYINQFNFNTPLLTNMTLHARYMYTVIFDYQNGMSSTMYVGIVEGGTAIYKPADPHWDGYAFNGWFTDPACTEGHEWAFADLLDPTAPADVVTENITLYAKWVGQEYYVSFKYTLDAVEQTLLKDGDPYEFSVRYGSVYGEGIDTATALMKKVIEDRGDLLFVRWQLPEQNTLGVYNDTICKPSSTVVWDPVREVYTYYLVAEFTDDALNIVLNINTDDPSASIESPVDYLLYADGSGVYTLTGNNATREGYRIIGWSFTSDGSAMFDIGSELTFTRTDPAVSPYIVNDKIVLYAVWERIRYTITIVQPAGGNIVATYGGQQYTGEFQAYFGDTVTLKFTDDSGSYQFAKWVLSGQGDLADDTQTTTDLSVIGSCAVYAQLRPLTPLYVKLYLDGGVSDSPQLVNLWTYDGNTAIAKFVRQSVETDGSGKHYGLYALSSRLGYFDIVIRGSDDSTLYNLGSVHVFDDGSGRIDATVYAVTVTNSIGLEGLPEFAIPDETITGFNAPEGYRIVSLSVTGADTVVDKVSYKVPAAPTSGVIFDGVLEMITLEVQLVSHDGFTYKIGDTPVTTLSYPYWSAPGVRSVFTALPDIYDTAGHKVGTPESAYGLDGISVWYSDANHLNPVSVGDTVVVVLYGHVIPKEYTVSFDANGGTGTQMSPIDMVYDVSVTLPANTYTMEGAVFMGWAKAADIGVAYTDGETVKNVSDGGTDTTLYAVWLYVTPYSGDYDGTSHVPSVEGTGATVYFSFSELNADNYMTGTTTPTPRQNADSYTYYYYAKDTKVAMAGSVSMTINKVDLTIRADKKDIVYGDEVPAYTATAIGLVGGETIGSLDGALSLSCSYVRYGNVGDFPITVGGVSSPNYNITFQNGVLTVAKKALEITGVSVADKVYDGTQAATITGTPALSGAVGSDVLSVSSAGVVAQFMDKNAGTGIPILFSTEYTVTGDKVDNYNVVQPVLTASISKNSITLRSASSTQAYNGIAMIADSLTVVGTFGDLEGLKTYEVTGTITDVGSVSNVFTYELKDNTSEDNYVLTIEYGTLTITPAAITDIVFTPYTGEYDGEAHDIASGMSAKTVNDQIPTWQFSQDGVVWVDMITVTNASQSGTYKYKVSAPNHHDSIGDVNVSVIDFAVEVPVLLDAVYTGEPYDPTAGLSSTKYTWTPVAHTDVGDYAVRFTLVDPLNNHWMGTDEAFVDVEYSITKAPSVVTVAGLNTEYDGLAHDLVTVTALSGGTIGFSLTPSDYTASIPEKTLAGGYVVYWKVTGDSNHSDLVGSTSAVILKADPGLTPSIPAFLTYDGTDRTLITVVAPAEVEVEYSVDGGAYTTTAPTGRNAGTYSVSIRNAETDNYRAASMGPMQVTIQQAEYDSSHIHFVDASYQYDGTLKTLEISVDSGFPIPGEIGVSYTNNTGTAVGTYNATVTFDTGDNYLPILPMSATLEIYVLPIEYTAVTYSGTYDGTAHPVVAVDVTTPGAVVTYSLDGSVYGDICPSITDKGTKTVYYRITAVGYTDVNKSVEASVSALRVEFTSAGAYKYFDGTPLTAPGVTLDDGSALAAGHSFTPSVTGTRTNAGSSDNTFTVTIRDASDNVVNSNYDIVYHYGSLDVRKATYAGTITFPDTEARYDGTQKSIVITATPALPAGVTVSYTGNTGTAVGVYDATASFNVGLNYNPIPAMHATLTIFVTDIVYTATAYSGVYDGTAHPAVTVDPGATPGAVVTYSLDGSSYTVSCPTITDFGTLQVYYRIAALGYNTMDGNVTASVSKLAVSFTSAGAYKNYDGTPLTAPGVTLDDGSALAAGHTFTPTVTGTITNFGTADNAFTVVILDGSDNDVTANYQLTLNKGTLDIRKAEFNHIHFDSVLVRYDGSEKTLLITVDAGYELPSEITVAYSGNTGTAVGIYNATATFTVSDNYVAILPMSATLTIHDFSMDFEVAAYNAVYDGAAHPALAITVDPSIADPSVTYSLDGVAYSDVCPSVTDVGSTLVYYRITAPLQDDVDGSVTAQVSVRPVSFTSASGYKVYDTTPLTLSTVTVDDGYSIAAGHTVVPAVTGTITNYGTADNAFTVTILDSSDNDVTANYDVKYNAGTLEIRKATYNGTIVFQDTEVRYDGTPKTLEITATPALPSEITPVYTGNSGTDIGTYHATVTFEVSDNYNAIEAMTADLIIRTFDMSFTATAYSGIYDGVAHDALTVVATTPGAVVTYSLDGSVFSDVCPTINDAGSLQVYYRITALGFDTVNDYKVANVSKLKVSFTSAGAYKTYDTTPLTESGVVINDGYALVSGHTFAADVTGTITNFGTADNTFTVTISDSSDNDVTANYDLEYNYGRLEIRKAVYSGTIVFQDTEVRYDGTPKMLEITATPALPSEITPVYTNNTGTEIDVYHATVTFEVTANYEPIASMSADLIIRTFDIDYTKTVYSGTYDGTAHAALTLSVTTLGAAIQYAVDGGALSDTVPQFTDAGTRSVRYVITALGYDTVDETVNVTIDKYKLTVSSGSASKTYDGIALTVPDLIVTGSPVAGHTVSGTATGTVTDVGSAVNPFTVSVIDGSDNDVTANYDIRKVEGTLSVSKAFVTIVILAHEPFQYDGTPKELEYTATGLAPTHSVYVQLRYNTATATNVNPINAGDYTVTVRTWQIIGGDSSNYDVDYSAEQTMSILPRYIDAPAADASVFVYDGTLKTYTVATSNLYTVSNNMQSNAGTYYVTIKLNEKTNNAWSSTGTSADLTYPFVIEKRSLSIVANQVSKVYGQNDPQFTYVVYGEAPGEVAWFSGSPAALTHNLGTNDIGVGTLQVGNNGAFRADNYTFSFDGVGRFTINPLTVDMPAAPGEYGTIYYDGTAKVAYADSDYYTVADGTATDVGTYTAHLTLKDTANYVWSDTLTSEVRDVQYWIALATINFSYTVYGGAYDGQWHDVLTVLNADGSTVEYSLDQITWQSDIPKVKDAIDSGIVYLRATKLYCEDFLEEIQFTITKVQLDVYVDDKTWLTYQPMPEFTFTGRGYVGNDDASSLTCMIDLVTTYGSGSPYGDYPIFCADEPVDVNYDIVMHNGTLAVALHMVKVIWNTTEYEHRGRVLPIDVEIEDETGHRTPCDVIVTDMDGNPVEFRDEGDYLVTVVLPDGYILDPADTGGLTQEVSIIEGSKSFVLWAAISLLFILILIAIIVAYSIKKKRARGAE